MQLYKLYVQLSISANKVTNFRRENSIGYKVKINHSTNVDECTVPILKAQSKFDRNMHNNAHK